MEWLSGASLKTEEKECIRFIIDVGEGIMQYYNSGVVFHQHWLYLKKKKKEKNSIKGCSKGTFPLA